MIDSINWHECQARPGLMFERLGTCAGESFHVRQYIGDSEFRLYRAGLCLASAASPRWLYPVADSMAAEEAQAFAKAERAAKRSKRLQTARMAALDTFRHGNGRPVSIRNV